ncbi:MAG: hypothetical protein ABGX16_06025 [Pirellulales bacterium]
MTHKILSVILLSGVILLGGCRSGLMGKRESELNCPTDIRQKLFWCAGEDALFSCPCGPDGEFYGMKPTCWGEWPASGADWRNAYCGAPAEPYSLSSDEVISTSEAISGVPLPASVDDPVPASVDDQVPASVDDQVPAFVDDPDKSYNPFGSSLQVTPAPPLAEESAKVEKPVDKLPSGRSIEKPDSLPALSEENSENAVPDSQELHEQSIKDKQGTLQPLPATQPNLHTNSLRSKFREPLPTKQAYQQVSLVKLKIPPAPVADKPSSVILVELRQQAMSEVAKTSENPDQKESVNGDISTIGPSKPGEAKGTEVTNVFFEWPMSVTQGDTKEPSVQIEVIPQRLPLVKSAKIKKASAQIQVLDHLTKGYKSSLFVQ